MPDGRATYLLVMKQSLLESVRVRNCRSEGNAVLHGELGAGPDRVVRGVHRVAEEHDVAVVPAFAADGAELKPASPVADQPVPVQVFAERATEVLEGLLVACLERRPVCAGVEPGPTPGLLVGLDEERAPVSGVRVGMSDEGAVVGLHRREHRARQRDVGPGPQIETLVYVDPRTEHVVARFPGETTDSVGRDDEIGIELVSGNPSAVPELDPGIGRMPTRMSSIVERPTAIRLSTAKLTCRPPTDIDISCGHEAATMAANVSGSAASRFRWVRVARPTPNPKVAAGSDCSKTRTRQSGWSSFSSRAAYRPPGPPPSTSTERSFIAACPRGRTVRGPTRGPGVPWARQPSRQPSSIPGSRADGTPRRRRRTSRGRT